MDFSFSPFLFRSGYIRFPFAPDLFLTTFFSLLQAKHKYEIPFLTLPYTLFFSSHTPTNMHGICKTVTIVFGKNAPLIVAFVVFSHVLSMYVRLQRSLASFITLEFLGLSSVVPFTTSPIRFVELNI